MDYSTSVKRTKPIPGGDTEVEYRQVMRKIMEGLTAENLDTVIFLCKDHIPPGREITTALQFLKYLEDRDLVSMESAVLVAEVLHIIRRMDLLKIIPCIKNKRHFEEEFLGLSYTSFSAYRVLTVQLQDELSKRDFETFRYECQQHLHIRSLDAATSVLSLVRKLEEEDVVSSDDYDELIKILQSIENVKPLKHFQRLLEGDESVAVPAGKQPQRQDSGQAIFRDRNYVQPQTTSPFPHDTSRRVEAMPYASPLPPQYEATPPPRRAQPMAFIDSSTHEKAHIDEMPARYDFNRDGMTMIPNSRCFRSDRLDEVTPKSVVASNSRSESRRGMPFQSLPPPQYSTQDSQRHHTYDGPYPSMPVYALSPPHYEEGPFDERPYSLHPVNTYPRLHQQRDLPLNVQREHPAQQQNRFDYPPQSMYVPSSHPQSFGTPRHAFSYPSMPLILPPAGNHTLTPLKEEMGGLSLAVGRGDSMDSLGGDRFLSNEEEDDLSNKATSSLKEATPAELQPFVAPEHEKKMEELRKRNEMLEKLVSDQKDFGSYKMDASPVGLCILINNVEFKKNRKEEELHRRQKLNERTSEKLPLPRVDLEDRVGSNVDADKLEKLFECFDFVVQRHNDLTSREIRRVLAEASLADHTEYDCFLLIILTHGDNGCIFGVDGFSVLNTEIQKPFFADNCVTLAHKPKIFIIQACQGVKVMPAYAPDSDVAHDGPLPEILADNAAPSKADFLLAFSTVPGYISYRSRVAGSYFVLEIVRIFKRHYHNQDLLSMMIKVSDEVGKYDKKQVPMPVPTLRKKVFFTLKKGCSMDNVDEEYQVEEALSQSLGAVGGTVTETAVAPMERVMTQETGEQE